MLIVDPMHNLLLGTGKHMLQLWLRDEIITATNYARIQNYVNSMVIPSDIGLIPHKIVSGFSGFTADQFKNWITVFSIPALNGIHSIPGPCTQNLACKVSWHFLHIG